MHAHQPVGNFDDVIERAYQQSYLPFIDVLSRHPSIHIGIHFTGSLLELLERSHPEYFERLRAMVKSGQVEMIGGGYYEPILVAIPSGDRHEQICRLADYVEEHFGRRPVGAWLAERVWEPQLPSSLAPSGVEYTLVDDNHFLGAGFELNQLYGHYLSEDQGHTVKVLPGLKALRYLIPFRSPSETIEFLRGVSAASPNGYAAMGDDLEKFGVWPGTFKLCYQDHWLENLFTAIEQNADWLETATPGAAVTSHPPLGRADLPTASYTEMMEWSLPTSARNRYHSLITEFANRGDALPFLRGGIWRNFFSKYSESNLLHKKMLHVSHKVHGLESSRRREEHFLKERERAKTLVLQAQCNDPYWHGVFGGLYSPHLRTALWRSLVEAETIVDSLAHRSRHFEGSTAIDFNGDGHEEIYFTSEQYAVLLNPADGATVSAIDCRPTNTALVNSLTRRRESYHANIKNLRANRAQGATSIHEQTRTKEEGLDRWLQYDRWPRNCFRLLLFEQGKTYHDAGNVRLDENAALAAGAYGTVELSPNKITLASEPTLDWPARKAFSFTKNDKGFEIACDVTLRRQAPGSASVYVGIETILNFLAPSAPDRYFETAGSRYPLRWGAQIPATDLRVVDEWQKIGVTLSTSGARDFWITPIETVSESEDGFERIYQGSQIIAVWPVELAQGTEWTCRLVLSVEGPVAAQPAG
jgi:alpha-amylase